MIFRTPAQHQLTMYTLMPGLVDLVPPYEAASRMPDWHKNMVPYFNTANDKITQFSKSRSTIKMCDGINSLLTTGLILPAWCDIRLLIHADGKWEVQCADPAFKVEEHPQTQRQGIFADFTHVKLLSPWHAVCNAELDFMFMPAPYHQKRAPDSIFIPPAIVSYKHQHGTNINMFLRKPRAGAYICEIRAGEPLVQIMPLTDQPIKYSAQFTDDRTIPDTGKRIFGFHAYKRLVGMLNDKK